MMNQPSPSRLVIPSSSTSPGSPTSMQTGRPPLWTNSNQRKMCRLYLYTTLQINEILDVVHRGRSRDSKPGKDSANKKLNALLDKEPRWLKPRNETDMQRRFQQLEKSYTRSNAIALNAPFARPHSYSAPPPLSQGTTTPIKQERDAQSATLEVSPWAYPSNVPFHSPAFHSNPISPTPAESSQAPHGRSISADFGDATLGSRLMRTNSNLSASTDQSTGSLDRILGGRYSNSYVDTVRRLVKRFTAPMNQMEMSPSPLSTIMATESPWLNDPDAPPSLGERPFPLPGDYLSLDLHLRQNPCFVESDEHLRRRCMCAWQQELSNPLWVTAHGVTPTATQLFTSGPTPVYAEYRDALGNGMLHFIAARGQTEFLYRALRHDFCASIINDRNSAGQTFLHVLGDAWLQNLNELYHLLEALEVTVFAQRIKFDFSAQDNYGRTPFHVIFSAGLPNEFLQHILRRFSGVIKSSRDAFGVMPASGSEIGGTHAESMELDNPMEYPQTGASPNPEQDPAAIKDTHFIEMVRLAGDNPKLEDGEGRNGLHCLAMASLSVKSVMSKTNMSHHTASRQKKKGQAPSDRLDSSEDRLTLRHSLAEGLLSSGVDPNHYDAYGNTPLMAFCAELPEDDDYKTGPTILQALVRSGADVNARNRAGETALHIAVRCGRKLAVKTLVDMGANVHVRDAAGRGLLAVADAKMRSCREDMLVEYCHFEACRAHLSGKACAEQDPTVLQEWPFPG